MKIICDRQELGEALALAGSIVPSRSTKPILQSLRISAREGRVSVDSTDLEVAISVAIDKADIERQGSALMPAQKAISIVRELDGDKVTLSCEDRVATLEVASARFRIVGENPDEFPEVPAFEEKDAIHFGRATLESMIRKTCFAAALEGARYALNGVLFDLRADRLRLVATDGKRLAMVERPVELASGTTFSRVVPTKAVQLLARIAHPDDPTIALKLKETSILARSSRAVLSAQLLQGHFPPYEAVIPKDHTKRLEVETAVFQAALRRAALLTAKDSQSVQFKFGFNKLELTSRTPDIGESRVELPLVYPYEPLEIGFNPHYLIDALKVVDHDRIQLELKDQNSPGVIREGEGLLYVIMPIEVA